MHQEKELLGRQQDAMRETAGPRELRTYPTMHRGHTLTHQFYSSVDIFQLRFFSASFFSALPKSNLPIINMTLNYAMHYRSVFCEKEGVVFLPPYSHSHSTRSTSSPTLYSALSLICIFTGSHQLSSMLFTLSL